MSDSYIHTGPGGTSFVGHDATMLLSAMSLKGTLKMMRMGLRFRISQKRALQLASSYTGRPYKRGQLELAEQHLTIWIETMKSALPITGEYA